MRGFLAGLAAWVVLMGLSLFLLDALSTSMTEGTGTRSTQVKLDGQSARP